MKRASTLTHPDARDPSIFARIAERLKKEYGAKEVIVYGSVARGAGSAA